MLDKNVTPTQPIGLLRRLAKDKSGNTLALLAAAILPLLGLVGGGIDMGRAYLASSRLQAACDAGVLAARKKLGTEAAVTGSISSDVAAMGNRFFNLNFREGIYATEDRSFTMTLEEDFAITGDATANVPTSIMTVFGFDNVPLSVECQALLSVRNLDVMMVLDTTGSMDWTIGGSYTSWPLCSNGVCAQASCSPNGTAACQSNSEGGHPGGSCASRVALCPVHRCEDDLAEEINRGLDLYPRYRYQQRLLHRECRELWWLDRILSLASPCAMDPNGHQCA